MRPRPVPPTPKVDTGGDEYGRPPDYNSATGPRDVARAMGQLLPNLQTTTTTT